MFHIKFVVALNDGRRFLDGSHWVGKANASQSISFVLSVFHGNISEFRQDVAQFTVELTRCAGGRHNLLPPLQVDLRP